MKPHVSTASGRALEAIRSAALVDQWSMMAASHRFGFNVLPADVKTPLLDRERELLAAGNRVLLAEFRAMNSPDLLLEKRCLAKAEAMQINWAREPTAAEAAATAAAERKRADAENEIAARTQQILAGEQIAREAKARQIAIKQIKESES